MQRTLAQVNEVRFTQPLAYDPGKPFAVLQKEEARAFVEALRAYPRGFNTPPWKPLSGTNEYFGGGVAIEFYDNGRLITDMILYTHIRFYHLERSHPEPRVLNYWLEWNHRMIALRPGTRAYINASPAGDPPLIS